MVFIIKFLQENSSWLKDIMTIVFSATATILAVLTYRRARATILQPKRTEVIKIQTNILIEFLKSFTDNGNNIDSSLDYINSFRYSFYLALGREGLIEFSKGSKYYDEVNANIMGWYSKTDYNPTGLALIKGNLDDYFEIYSKDNLSEEPLNLITNKAWFFLNNLRNMSNSPFIPSDIMETLDKIGNDFYDNMFVLMPSILAYPDLIAVKKIDDINTSLHIRQFEKTRKHHIEDNITLKKKIRKYLEIDGKW